MEPLPLPEQTIEGSQVKQIVVNPLTGEFVDGRVVGDGDLARRVFFDELEGRPQLLRKTAQNGSIRVGG